jgi:hypothetical protein
MKAFMKKRFFNTIFTILLAVGLSSCFDPVFYNITQDVAPEDETVSGSINSIIRYTVGDKEILVLAADGGLRYKNAETQNVRSGSNNSSWKTYDKSLLPFELHHFEYYGTGGAYNHEGQTIIKVAADADTLYLVTIEYTKDEAEGKTVPHTVRIWANSSFSLSENGSLTSTSDWVEIASESYDSSKKEYNFFTLINESRYSYWYSDFNVFCSNTPQKEHRVAYLRNGFRETESATYYKLNGTNPLDAENPTAKVISNENVPDNIIILKDAGATDISSSPAMIIADNSTGLDIDSVAYLNGNYYFFDSIAVTTNETKDTDATIIYYGSTRTSNRSTQDHSHISSSNLLSLTCESAGSSITPTKTTVLDAGEDISCLAMTKDSLFIGRADYTLSSTYAGGVVKMNVNADGTPLLNSNNSAYLASFTTNAAIQLSSSYQIFTLLVADPSKDELDSIIYSSIGFKSSGTSTAVNYKNVGLWAYYPSRGNWNRE